MYVLAQGIPQSYSMWDTLDMLHRMSSVWEVSLLCVGM